LHRAFSPPDTVTHVENQCRSAGWGCIECKKVLFENINAELTPIRARAEEIRAHPQRVDEVANDGAATARAVAQKTIREVKDMMGLA
jgi:tryptophanyl-tRNA synthetase